MKKLVSKLYISDITPPSRFLLLKELVSLPFSFHLCQFLSNYLFSNLPSSHLYNIFAIYFSNNSSLLKFFSSTISSFFYLLTLVLIFPSNSTTNSFAFSKSSSLSQLFFEIRMVSKKLLGTIVKCVMPHQRSCKKLRTQHVRVLHRLRSV